MCNLGLSTGRTNMYLFFISLWEHHTNNCKHLCNVIARIRCDSSRGREVGVLISKKVTFVLVSLFNFKKRFFKMNIKLDVNTECVE